MDYGKQCSERVVPWMVPLFHGGNENIVFDKTVIKKSDFQFSSIVGPNWSSERAIRSMAIETVNSAIILCWAALKELQTDS